MEGSTIQQLTRRCVTVADPYGHEFDFERAEPPHLYAVRWKNNRLPIDANRHREEATLLAWLRFEEHEVG